MIVKPTPFHTIETDITAIVAVLFAAVDQVQFQRTDVVRVAFYCDAKC